MASLVGLKSEFSRNLLGSTYPLAIPYREMKKTNSSSYQPIWFRLGFSA